MRLAGPCERQGRSRQSSTTGSMIMCAPRRQGIASFPKLAARRPGAIADQRASELQAANSEHIAGPDSTGIPVCDQSREDRFSPLTERRTGGEQGQLRFRYGAGDRCHGSHAQTHPRKGRHGQFGQRFRAPCPEPARRRPEGVRLRRTQTGFLEDQATPVLDAYREAGYEPRATTIRDDWTTLTLAAAHPRQTMLHHSARRSSAE